MQIRRALIPLATLLCACSAELGAETEVVRWSLVADEDGGLRDPRYDHRSYPNAFAVDRLELYVDVRAGVCADLAGGPVCGGPARGIPYTLRAVVDGGRSCLRVIDVWGAEVDRVCSAAAVAPLGTDECREATTGDGVACRICTDAEGLVTD